MLPETTRYVHECTRELQDLPLRTDTDCSYHMKTVIRNRSLLLDGHCLRAVVQATLYEVALWFQAASRRY